MALVSLNAKAQITLPKESSYTLTLEPFARHAGTNAMELTHAHDGSGRVFVSTQSGQVFVYGEDGSERGVFLDLASADVGFRFNDDRTYPFRGLMYIAFHRLATPDTPGYRQFYTAHQVAIDENEKPDFDSKTSAALAIATNALSLPSGRPTPTTPIGSTQAATGR